MAFYSLNSVSGCIRPHQLSGQLFKHGNPADESARNDGLTRQRLELENQLTLLATVGNTAPFISLLGTVWGIMHALQNLGGSTGISLETVAGPVGEALVATAMGLFAAIPAVAGYNLLIRRLRKLLAIIEVNTRALLARGPAATAEAAP
jgi:biopolymer transport protein ExbB